MTSQASQPRVEPQDVDDHLRLLSAFHRLYQESINFVHQAGDPNPPPSRLFREAAHRAAYRLQLWLDIIAESPEAQEGEPISPAEIPPLDVALALHSLMLSPHRFFEDAQLRFPQLQRFKSFPFDLINPRLSFDHPSYEPELVKEATELWTQRTSLRYNPIESLSADLTRFVACPGCNAHVAIPWHAADNTGFADEFFNQACQCNMTINNDSLCVRKFLSAILAYDTHDIPLPNTIDMTHGQFDQVPAQELSKFIKIVLVKANNDQFPSTQQLLAHASAKRQTGMEYLMALLNSADLPLSSKLSVAVILLPFGHSYPFTQDIVAATMLSVRQLRSLAANHLLPKHGGGNVQFNFAEAYPGYVEYLNILGTTPGTHDGPALYVDILWHTHILKARIYREDCLRLIGIFPNHVPRGELTQDDSIVAILQHQSKLFFQLATQYDGVNSIMVASLQDVGQQVADSEPAWQLLEDNYMDVPFDFRQTHPDVVVLRNKLAETYMRLAHKLTMVICPKPTANCQDITPPS